MKYKVFVASRSYSKFSSDTKQYFQDNNCELIYNKKGGVYKEEDLLEIISEYDAIIVGVDEVTERVIKKGDKLKVIGKNGVGVDNIDLEAASKAGIFVINAPNTNSHSVADLAVGLMLSLGRSIPVVNRMAKNGHWNRKIGCELWEKTVGVIGTGDIGQKVVHRVQGFNCNVLANDKEQDYVFSSKYDVEYTKLEKLLRNSDYITLHLPFNSHTKNMIGAEELKMMKESAYLINTARGGIVNEDDLYKALKNDVISGAACDVFAEEPPEENKLFDLENFIATSHIGAYTYETNDRTGMKVARNVVAGLKGERPDEVVNDL